MKNNKVLLTIISVIKNDDKRFSKTLKSLDKIHGSELFEHIIIENINDKIDLRFSNKLKKNSELKYFNDKKNSNGIYGAMNIGVEKARGKYILFLNAGDTLFMKKKIIIHVLNDMINQFSIANIICFNAYLSLESKKILLKPTRSLLYKMLLLIGYHNEIIIS